MKGGERLRKSERTGPTLIPPPGRLFSSGASSKGTDRFQLLRFSGVNPQLAESKKSPPIPSHVGDRRWKDKYQQPHVRIFQASMEWHFYLDEKSRGFYGQCSVESAVLP